MKKDIFDELIVVKRSGQRVNFNSYKIAVAIKGAFEDIYSEYDEKNVNRIYEKVLDNIIQNYNDRKTINVEDIQDIIENMLQQENQLEAYNAFSEYRKKRAESRKAFKLKQQHKFARAMEKIAYDNPLKNDTEFNPKEILIKYGKTVLDEFAKAYIIDNKYLREHEEGNIYIHDISTFPLGMLSHVHLSNEKYFEEHDSINNLTELILKSKDEVSGEVSIPSLDYLLETWVIRKFRITFEDYLIKYLKLNGFDSYINIKKLSDLINKINDIEVDMNIFEQFISSNQVKYIFETAHKDSIDKIQKLIYKKLKKLFINLENNEYENPNFSISFGTNESNIGHLINIAIIDIIKELYFSNLSFIFKLKNKNSKYLEFISEIINDGKRIFVSYIDSSFNKDNKEVEYFANSIRIFENNNSDYRSSDGRLLVGMTSINIARIALESETKTIKEFYEKLDETLEIVKNELLLMFEALGNKNKENYNVLFTGNIDTDEKLLIGQKIRKVIKNSSLGIGLVGLKECIMILCKDQEKQYEFTLDILDYINKKCVDFSIETKLNFIICEPYNSRVRKEFMRFDKTIYGIKREITEKEKYDLISNLKAIKNDYRKIANIQKRITGGNMIEILLSEKTSIDKIKKTIIDLAQNDIGFIKIRKEKK